MYLEIQSPRMHRLKRRLKDLLGAELPATRFFEHGELRIAILGLLDESPAHGYELMTRLEARCGGGYHPSAGAIYPLLDQLEDEGLLTITLDEGRKTAQLTARGRKEVAEHREDLALLWRRGRDRAEWGELDRSDTKEVFKAALRLGKLAVKVVAKAHGDPAVNRAVQTVIDDAQHRLETIHERRRR